MQKRIGEKQEREYLREQGENRKEIIEESRGENWR